MGVLIDTSVLIEYERGRVNLEAWTTGREEETFFLSVVTASELLHGVHRAKDPVIRARRTAFVEGVLENMPLLPVEIATARMHARLWADLAEEGRVIGAHDLWLAAACLTYDLRMATANVREFNRVPALKVEDWSSSPSA